MTETDRIIIVGAGPVGSVTGLALAQAGIPVLLLDQLDAVPADHRASTLHPSTLAMVAPLGMTPLMLDRGLPSARFQFRDRVGQEIVAEFDYAVLADELPFPMALQLEQHKTIEIANRLARDLPHFEIRRGHSVVGVDQGADGAVAEVELPDGSRTTIEGRYLIGCDGGRSVVRKAMDIDFPGFTWEERFIIVATSFDMGAAGGFQYRNYVAHPDRWSALIKVPGERDEGVWRGLFPVQPDESEDVVTSDEWIQARFAESYPYDPPYETLHRNLYNVHQRVADSFRRGRVLLAGDAAHVNNPVGGMGMNSGIHDGLNLAEKLVAIWRGEGDAEALLDRYDRQRRPMAAKYVQAQSIRNKETLQERDPAKRQARLDELRRTAADPEAHKEYLRRAGLIRMVEEANAIE